MAMPAFGDAYSDAEIAAAANYVTERFGRRGLAPDGGENRLAAPHPVTA
jgi:mono/diheme cytochrome c family protein